MFKTLATILLGFTVCMLLTACNGTGPSDQAIERLGVLRVAIVKDPHVYFANDRVLGFEYDLVKKYADSLGVRFEPTFVSSREQVRELVSTRRVHLGLGMLPVTAASSKFAFGPSITTTSLIVVTHTDAPRVTSASELASLSTVALDMNVAIDPFVEICEPEFTPTVLAESDADTLLSLVEQQAFDAAIISAADFELLKRKYPYLKKRFTLRESVPLAWIVAKPAAPGLLRSLNTYIRQQSMSGYLAKRWQFHYDHLGGFDFVDARKFMRRYSAVLPQYRDEFKKAALEHGYDWRLLAALSYQESHWDPSAISPTGVKGLMMLTRNTAKELGVVRTDPVDSIRGGTQYLASLQSRLDERIAVDEQPLMALAAYNVGLGHLRDAQRVARYMNKNDSEWHIVKAHLPLLSKEKYAKHTRYGRARGGQAVHYVEGVRRYYAIMRLLEPSDWVIETRPQAQSLLNQLTLSLL